MAFDKNAPAAERQHLTKVSGFDGYWATFAGGDVEAKTNTVYDGGSRIPQVLADPSETKNITVTRPYKPAIHAPLVRKLVKQVGSWRTTISRWDTDPDLGPVGAPVVYPNALLVSVKRPQGDASSGDAGMLELEFAVATEA